MTPRERTAQLTSKPSGRVHRIPRLIAAAVLIGAFTAPGALVSAAGEAVTMEARILLQGHARVGSWMAIEVQLRNDGPPIDGEISLAGGAQGRTRFGIAVDLATQSAKTYFLYAQPPGFERDLTVSLVTGGATVAKSTVAFLAHDASQQIVGVVAERPGDIIREVDLAPSVNGSQAVLVPLSPADLPDRSEGWSALDGLIWQDVDSNALSPEQLAAMRVWLAGGGRLVIAGGSAGIGTLSGFPDELLPFRPTSTVEVPRDPLLGLFPSLPAGTADLPALAGELSRGRSLAAVGDRTIAAEAAHGSGTVTIVGVDPTAAAIAETKDVVGLWRRLLPARTGGAIVSGDDSQLVQALQQLPALALPPIGGLLVLLGGYILLVGPINYLVLRRLDRREWAWITMPALIGIFAVAAYGYGAALRGVDVIINEVSVIRGAPDTEDAMAQVYLGVFSPSRGTYQLEVPGGALLASPFASDMFGVDGATLDILQGDPARVRDLSVPFGSLRSIRAESPTSAPRMGATLDLVDGVLVGSVVNRSEVTLETVAVVLGGSVALLGDLEPGEAAAVSLKLTNDPFGRSLADKILGQSFFDRPEGRTDADARLLARSSILNQLTFDPMVGFTGRLSAEMPIVLAWGTADVLDVRVEGQVPRRVANSLFYIPVPMRVTGTTTFAGDLIRSMVVDSGALFSKDPTWISLGTGSATVSYRTIAFDGTLAVSALRVALSMGEVVPMDGGKPVSPLPDVPEVCEDITNSLPEGCVPRVQDGLPEVELFDRAGEGAWVRLPHLSGGAVYIVTDPGRYVDAGTGTVLVRFVNEQPDGGLNFQFNLAITGTVR